MLEDRHTATEATISLSEFEADVPASEHNQMWRQIVEFQRFNICEGPGGLEARNGRNGRARSDVEEHLVAYEHARPAVIQVHLKSFRCHEAPSSHDQFGATRLVVLQVGGNLALDHVALALANLLHVDGDRTSHRAKIVSVSHKMSDLRAPDLILARHTVDVGTGATDILALDNGSSVCRTGHMPCE